LNFLLYDSKGKNVVVNAIVLYAYIVFTDTVISSFFSSQAANNSFITLDEPNIYLISGLAESLVLICTHRTIIFLIKKSPLSKISIILNLYMIFVLILEILALSYFVSLNFYNIPIILFSLGFAVLDGLIFYLYKLVSKNNLLEQQTKLLEQQQNNTVKYYKELQDRYNNTQQLLHDIKKHIQVIITLDTYDDNLKGIYSNSLIKSIDEVEQQFQCSNKIINAIIWDKIQKCHQLNIDLNIDMQDIEFDFMDDLEITILFANLLDNAIEACESSERDTKEINLRIHKFKDYVVLKLENSLGKKTFNTSSGALASTKPGHLGIGMVILNNLVNKYSGNLDYEYSENYFVTKIILSSIK